MKFLKRFEVNCIGQLGSPPQMTLGKNQGYRFSLAEGVVLALVKATKVDLSSGLWAKEDSTGKWVVISFVLFKRPQQVACFSPGDLKQPKEPLVIQVRSFPEA